MQRNPSESKQHIDLIQMMVNHFNIEGYRNIKADISGMTRPDVIYGTKQNHVPDLAAQKNGITVILEAETSGSIHDSHTTSQWSLFADAAKNDGGEFHVAVPKGSRNDTKQQAAGLSINIDTIWTPK
jgi:hypothetical protein